MGTCRQRARARTYALGLEQLHLGALLHLLQELAVLGHFDALCLELVVACGERLGTGHRG